MSKDVLVCKTCSRPCQRDVSAAQTWCGFPLFFENQAYESLQYTWFLLLRFRLLHWILTFYIHGTSVYSIPSIYKHKTLMLTIQSLCISHKLVMSNNDIYIYIYINSLSCFFVNEFTLSPTKYSPISNNIFIVIVSDYYSKSHELKKYLRT